VGRSWFDGLTMSGIWEPRVLSLSKGGRLLSQQTLGAGLILLSGRLRA
jgi:hypothetical protein